MNSTEFGQIHAAIETLQAARFASPVALATITRTTGSTFRHAGARMLVLGDGDVVCALSGGCPQRDIVERAKHAMLSGDAHLARYNRDSGLDVMIEMGCGGELEVLIEPLREPAHGAFLHAIAQGLAKRQRGFMASVFASRGDALARPRRLIAFDDVVWDDLDDARLTTWVLTQACSAQSLAGSVRHEHAGEELDVLVETLSPPQMLVLIGVNAVSLALAEIGAALSWQCVLVDHTDAHGALPRGARSVKAAPGELLGQVPHDAQCAVLAMTFNLERDIAYLKELAHAPFGYIGAIGSRERSRRLRAACEGVRLFAPAGLNLGAENPQEIAVSIVAEIIAQRSRQPGNSLSEAEPVARQA